MFPSNEDELVFFGLLQTGVLFEASKNFFNLPGNSFRLSSILVISGWLSRLRSLHLFEGK